MCTSRRSEYLEVSRLAWANAGLTAMHSDAQALAGLDLKSISLVFT